MKFKNREEAGKKLGVEIDDYLENKKDVVILAIPRGGVLVAYPISKWLGIPFHLIITKKLTAPQAPEVAIGAIAPDGTYKVNQRTYSYFNPSPSQFEVIKETALSKVKTRLEKYTNGQEPDVREKTVIIIDDGIATGYTALVAGKYVKNKGAKKVILAVPVCPADSVSRMLEVFDDFLYVHKESLGPFSVGAFYIDFHQNTDQELFDNLNNAEQNHLLYQNLEKATT